MKKSFASLTTEQEMPRTSTRKNKKNNFLLEMLHFVTYNSIIGDKVPSVSPIGLKTLDATHKEE